jgi:hypothetical protein
MDTAQSKDGASLPAKIISIIFHPLLMPVYGYLIIFSVPVLGYLPFEVKRLILFIVLINNVLLPLSLFPFLKYRNIISSWLVSSRTERMIPLLFTTLLYATTSYIMFRFPIPAFLKSYIFAIFFLSLAVSIIYFWKTISIHSAAAGALSALVLILSFKLYSPLIVYLVAVILISGLSLSARLRLQYRTPAEVWSGFLTGFCIVGLYLWFF